MCAFQEIQIKEYAGIRFNSSYQIEIFMFDNHEEFYLIHGWMPDKLPTHFQLDMSARSTQVSMKSHLILDKTGGNCRTQKSFKRAKCIREHVKTKILSNECMTPWHWKITNKSREMNAPCSNASKAYSVDALTINYLSDLSYQIKETNECPGIYHAHR